MSIIYVVGMGPGNEQQMTLEAVKALEESDVIIGYTVYLELLPKKFKEKKLLSTPMRREEERCRLCFEEAVKGNTVSIICSGDAGVYGMASLMYELQQEFEDTELIIIPGVTAALSGAALLGAPINHDFCVISLSDLLTPWDKIEKRLSNAAMGDFAIVLYNPSSRHRPEHLRRACDILLKYIEEDRCCGIVENIGRSDTKVRICTLKDLRDTVVNMFTTVFIGNETTQELGGRMVTKRGYRAEVNR